MSAHETAARDWLEQDPDPVTRAELAGVLERVANGDAAARDDLEDRFGSRLAFGTAGLRGALGAGPNRMNRVLVAQAAAGFAAYLSGRAAAGTPRVVIGYDGRRNSEVFARDSAEILAGAGLTALLLPRTVPTPVLAFAVRHFGADAGVMVTASHNPPGDNGYKVYLGGEDAGSQIVSPTDAEIADQITRVAETTRVPDLPRTGEYEVLDGSVIDAYVAATAAFAPAGAPATGLRWVYTAMHGVGWDTFSRIVRRAGYPDPDLVSEQIDPDPAFPTVAFPNPEEPGAMDLALATAERTGAELVLANDPDADRLAVAIPDEDGWRQLTGNEVGLLLGWRAARAARGTPGASLACSMVSSPGLGVIAEHYGLDHYETLTGFKWISRAPGMVYGFEEALGYLVNPGTVRDKDGISAAIAILSLAAEARGRGTDLAGLLTEMSDTFGHFGSGQVSIRVEDVRVIDGIMRNLRSDPPAMLGKRSVSRADDLLERTDGGPTGNLLRYWLDDGSRVIVRPSGTEPKLKVYLDVRGSTAAESAARISALEHAAHELVSARRR